jgi:hypothetical protein
MPEAISPTIRKVSVKLLKTKRITASMPVPDASLPSRSIFSAAPRVDVQATRRNAANW